MRINRRFLYAGVFLLAIGAVLVLADLGVFDATVLTNALRVFWPLAVIALGVGVVLRRTQFSLQSGLLAAALPGLVLAARSHGSKSRQRGGHTGEPGNVGDSGLLSRTRTVSLPRVWCVDRED